MSPYVILIVAALVIFALSVMVLVMARRQRRLTELPDGDYIVSVEEVRNGPRGPEVVYIVDSPGPMQGRRVVVKGSQNGS